MRIAQISDPHVSADGLPVHGLVDTDAALARVIAAINALEPQPDLVVATGDLAHDGEPEATVRAHAALSALRAPVLVCAGNHDRGDAVRASFGPFPGDAGEAGVVYAVEGHPLRLIVLDASTDDPLHAALPAAQVAWLAARLAEEPERPVLIFLHHPPFDTGIDWLDSMGIAQGRHEMGELIAAHRGVAAILCGHLHRPMRGAWYGVPVLAAPSVMDRVTFTGRHPDGSPVVAVTAPPGFVLHRWTVESGLVSELRFLDGHAEPWLAARPDPAPCVATD